MNLLELIKPQYTPSHVIDKKIYTEIDNILDKIIQENRLIELHIAGDTFNASIINTGDFKGYKALIISVTPTQYEAAYNHIKKAKTLTVYINADNHILKFESMGIGEIKGKQGFLIKYPKELIPAQRRNYFRVKPSKYKPLKLSFRFKDNTFNIDTIDDISGGGISFFIYTECALRRRDIIADMTINLHTMEVPIYRSVVVNIIREETRTKYMVQFKAIEDNAREHIINYVIEKQREYMKKGYF